MSFTQEELDNLEKAAREYEERELLDGNAIYKREIQEKPLLRSFDGELLKFLRRS